MGDLMLAIAATIQCPTGRGPAILDNHDNKSEWRGENKSAS
jgi:hypothetical protein